MMASLPAPLLERQIPSDGKDAGGCADRGAERRDTGASVDEECSKPPAGLHGLGVAKAQAAVKLARRIVERFERKQWFGGETYSPGRYYGAMPTVLQYQVDAILCKRAAE